MVVTDANGEDVYVIMGLSQYEHLRSEDVGMEVDPGPDPKNTEPEEIVHEETRPEEVASTPSPSPKSTFSIPDAHIDSGEDDVMDIWDVLPPAGQISETWNLDNISTEESLLIEEQYKKYTQETLQEAVAEIAPKPQIQEKDVKLEEKLDDIGEEQYYLEPIE